MKIAAYLSTRTTAQEGQYGQVLAITALMMIVLIGFAGLAIDVSAAYLAERNQRVIADAAALAGGQDLQIPGSRQLPGSTEYQRARDHAMDVLATQLDATSRPAAAGSCLTSAGCALPGTGYVVSIQTPSPTCVECDPRRAVQVTISQPAFSLSFGALFGQDTWTVNSTSVAGIIRARQYGVAALRPPDPRSNGTDANEDDIFIKGGAQLVVKGADVHTNTNMRLDNNSELVLDAGSDIYYYGPRQRWAGDPVGVQATSLLPDPQYPIPTRVSSTPVYTTPARAMGTDPADAATYDPDYAARCAAQQALVPSTYRELKTNYQVNDSVNVTAVCFRPGTYRFQLVNTTDRDAFLLEPGVYFLDYGMNVGSTIIGGYEPGKPGVALVFLEAKNNSGTPGRMRTSSPTSLLAINFGSAYLNSAGTLATAADGPQGLVQTPGPRPLVLSLMVVPDPACVVVEPAPPACRDSDNQTLNLTGGGSIFLAGVQYAPTDNAEFTGNAGQDAEIGQLIAWTLKFNSAVFNINASVSETNGVLRLDAACSPTEACNP
jgi:hypothetical protein